MFQQCVYEPPHPLHSINSLAGIFADSCAISNGAAFQALRSYQARLLQTVKLLVCRVFGTVSYYVQKLFSAYQGVRYIDTNVSSSDEDSHNHGVAASASCQNTACTKVAFKVSQSD